MSDNPTKPKRTEKRTEMEDRKLVEYAERFLSTEPGGASVAEQAARFAAQLRSGCHQDLVRLIGQLIRSTPMHVSGTDALKSLRTSLTEGGIDAWGLPDCDCKKPGCVYCSTGMATTPAKR